MTDFSFLADDGLVDALIMEIAGLLRRLIEHGEAGSIDFSAFRLSPSCVASLEQRLGHGEVTVRWMPPAQHNPRNRLSRRVVDAARDEHGRWSRC